MSQAVDLLNSLSGDDVVAYTANTEEEHIVVGNDRFIRIPDSIKRLGVQHDKDIETVTFDCPRYWDKYDLSQMVIYVNYVLPNGENGRYAVKNIVAIGKTIHFDWTISDYVTQYKGTISFLICAVTTDEEGNEELHWNSELNQEAYISEGLECTESPIHKYPDIITHLLTRMDEVEAIATPEAMQTYTDTWLEENHARILAEIEAKGAATLDTIPEDYTETHNMAEESVRTKGDAIVCTAEGSTISVSDSSDDHLRGLRVFGKTTQATTTGKNLCSIGTTTIDVMGQLENAISIPAGTYTFSAIVTSSDTDENACLVRFYDESESTVKDITVSRSTSNERVSHTFTIEHDCKHIYFYTSLRYVTSENDTASFVDIQIEAGEVATDYEVFSGGIPAPNPSYPQDLKSIGEDGSMTFSIASKNLLDFVGILGDNYTNTLNGLTVTVKDGYATTTGTNENDGFTNILHAKDIPSDKRPVLPAGTYTTHPRLRVSVAGKVTPNKWANLCGTFAFDELFTITGFYIAYGANETADETVPLMLVAGKEVPTVYEDCESIQTVTVDRVLHGIQTKSGGVYTRIDSEGNKWICDEIDLERGVYIQRVNELICTGEEAWTDSSAYPAYSLALDRQAATGLCTHMNRLTVTELRNGDQGVYLEWSGYALVQLKEYFSTLDDFIAFLIEQNENGTPVTFRYAYEVPIETPLTAEEITAFKALHTNYPNTTILNNTGVWMSAKYNTDTKTYIDTKIAARIPTDGASTLVDEVTGTVYRLKVSNGKLMMEEV